MFEDEETFLIAFLETFRQQARSKWILSNPSDPMPVVQWNGTSDHLEKAPGINSLWHIRPLMNQLKQLSKLTDAELAQRKQQIALEQQQLVQENAKKRKQIETEEAVAAAAAASSAQRNDASESNKKPRIYHEVSVNSEHTRVMPAVSVHLLSSSAAHSFCVRSDVALRSG